MDKRISLYDLLYYFVGLYAIATMTQDLLPFLPLNRIFYFGIFVCVTCIIVVRREKNAIIYSGIILLDMILVQMVYGRFGYVSNYIIDYIYFVTSMFWLIFLANQRRRITLLHAYQRHNIFNNVVILFSAVLIAIALVTKMGYQYSWESIYFVGFCGLTHTAASSMCLICAMILLSYSGKNFHWGVLALLLFFCFGIFETGARTYIVPALLIVYLYIRKCPGNKSYKHFLYVFGIILVVVVLTKSNVMEKFNFANTINQYNSVDKLTQQTSGRSTFWLIDLKGFAYGSLFAKLFGHGHGYTYYLNSTYYNLTVWAHNDFIQLLVGGGIITLCIYLSGVKKCFASILQKFGFIDKWILIIYWFVAAFFNGFYNYSHYFLSFVLICLLYDQLIERKEALEIKGNPADQPKIGRSFGKVSTGQVKYRK